MAKTGVVWIELLALSARFHEPHLIPSAVGSRQAGSCAGCATDRRGGRG